MTAYEHLLELAADRVRRRGSTQSELLCPAHEDRTPSLSLSIGRDENAVIHCHAGCPAADVMAAWPGGRLPVAALFDTFWNRDRDRELEATYDYLDETGRLLFQVVRKPGKQFRQRRPDGAGGWVWKLGDTRRVLYRLPRILEAVAAGASVYVCEGEKDVHALEAAGVTATCNPGGAGKWRNEYAEALEGARVVVVRDRDDTGRRHADAVVASLRGQGMFRRNGRAAARSVRLVEATAARSRRNARRPRAKAGSPASSPRCAFPTSRC
jgi:5S rRNA maturation endonuclease (ribonuclease M5)